MKRSDSIAAQTTDTSRVAATISRSHMAAACFMPVFITPASMYAVAHQAAMMSARLDAEKRARRFEAVLN